MADSDASAAVGAVMWVLIFYPLWSPRSRRKRKDRRARASTVSRNPKAQTGPMWEQDAPFPECFTDDGEDDL